MTLVDRFTDPLPASLGEVRRQTLSFEADIAESEWDGRLLLVEELAAVWGNSVLSQPSGNRAK